MKAITRATDQKAPCWIEPSHIRVSHNGRWPGPCCSLWRHQWCIPSGSRYLPAAGERRSCRAGFSLYLWSSMTKRLIRVQHCLLGTVFGWAPHHLSVGGRPLIELHWHALDLSANRRFHLKRARIYFAINPIYGRNGSMRRFMSRASSRLRLSTPMTLCIPYSHALHQKSTSQGHLLCVSLHPSS